MRRATIGGALVEAMVEYSLDLDMPAHVFEDPVVKAMSDAAIDIMTWPNVRPFYFPMSDNHSWSSSGSLLIQCMRL